ncbi:MerR family transcriptional regulator [Bacillus lacus]|uniref:Chromosome-anchoring protein RacA n=1 Tax=Metabacillus lacus TaxID=1983721 RepID=A0A7X2IWG7_9BACI|nr:MerR family transcriptional regulator [Metabacillus lacus]MRX71087.1 MerR family transcriptional regulator [Metabacillus lacus]
MNTTAVAKLLGVSPKTVQRWVKQLDLQMERNELGHYLFTNEDIEMLKGIQEQLHNGILLQDISVAKKKPRKAIVQAVPSSSDKSVEALAAKVSALELRLDQKADSVVSYQLLQHRQEMEELHHLVISLNHRLDQLEAAHDSGKGLEKDHNVLQFDAVKPPKKKKNFISMLFSF